MQAAYAATFSFIHALGAKISAGKCYLFSTCPTTRAILRDRYWIHIGAKVQVLMFMRDLGGHLCRGSRLCGTTINKRLTKATELRNALCHRPWSPESKIKVVNTLVLATGLYAVEAAPPAERSLARFATSIVKAIGPHSADSSNTMAFHTATTFALEPGC